MQPMTQPSAEIRRAIACLPSGLFLMTAAFDGRRGGVIVRSVLPCADEPVLLSVAIRKGHWIEPLIRDSHHFGICLVDPADRLMVRKFADDASRDADPFDCFPVDSLVSASPLLKRAWACFDCLVVRHFDLEADHGLYVGQVLSARVSAQVPASTIRGDDQPLNGRGQSSGT